MNFLVNHSSACQAGHKVPYRHSHTHAYGSVVQASTCHKQLEEQFTAGDKALVSSVSAGLPSTYDERLGEQRTYVHFASQQLTCFVLFSFVFLSSLYDNHPRVPTDLDQIHLNDFPTIPPRGLQTLLLHEKVAQHQANYTK